MHPYLDLIESLKKISVYATESIDSWQQLSIKGGRNLEILSDYESAYAELKSYGFTTSLKFYIDGVVSGDDDLDDYKESPDKITQWEVRLNKSPLLQKRHANGWNYNFFFNSRDCEHWLNDINPILGSCPINEYTQLRIYVCDLPNSFGGEFTQFLRYTGVVEELGAIRNINLPSTQNVKELIHILSDDQIYFDANAWYIEFSNMTPVVSAFVEKACIHLGACIVNEYHSSDKVIIDGIKRIPMRLIDARDIYTKNFYEKLIDLVSWIFEDRPAIRRKLFNERVGLDYEPNDSFLATLKMCLPNALQQAKERYNFVILDRKDAYVKELKDLLKDIRTQSELYSVKIRSLLSNFLRDLLGALLLIGFTIFTKFKEFDELVNSQKLNVVFFAMGCYYAGSILFQAVVDLTDIYVSKKELLYWKNATKELLPEKDFKKHIDLSLKGRRISLRIIYPTVAIGYVIVSLVCFRFQDIYLHWFVK